MECTPWYLCDFRTYSPEPLIELAHIDLPERGKVDMRKFGALGEG
jgi:hypothetical protein